MERLSSRGRMWRLVATSAAGLLLLAGTVRGTDDHFPFGPFTMYAGAAGADQPTIDTRLEATDVHGDTVLLTERHTGIRRAEIEGQLHRIAQEPELLALALRAYERRNPHAPRLVEIRVVIRWHEIHNFQPTGDWTEEVVAVWEPSPAG
jgi:hypothetical protein